MWQPYQQFLARNGDPVPMTLNRNATAHSVSARQFGKRNAGQDLLVAFGLIIFLTRGAVRRAEAQASPRLKWHRPVKRSLLRRRPSQNRSHRLDVDLVDPSQLLLERSIAVPLDELSPLTVRQTDLLLPGRTGRADRCCAADLRLLAVEHPLKRDRGVR